jgi:hypothetical protein
MLQVNKVSYMFKNILWLNVNTLIIDPTINNVGNQMGIVCRYHKLNTIIILEFFCPWLTSLVLEKGTH